MWTWTLNWGAVRDDLVVGSCPMEPADLDRIKTGTGATAMLSLQHPECHAHFKLDYPALVAHGRTIGLDLVNTPMRDFDPPDQRKHLAGAVLALNDLLAAGHRVYVHCTAGFNRGPLTVLSYLTFVETRPFEQALATLVAGRPEAVPTWEAYHGTRDDLLAGRAAEVQLRAFVISQERPQGSPEADWSQAEREIIREALIASPVSVPTAPDPEAVPLVS